MKGVNNSFEMQWRDAFEGAEIKPSEQIWKNIELELQRGESGQMKKRLLMFQLMAAASVALAMTIGGVAVYYYPDKQFVPAENNAMMESVESEKSDDINKEAASEITATDELGSEKILKDEELKIALTDEIDNDNEVVKKSTGLAVVVSNDESKTMDPVTDRNARLIKSIETMKTANLYVARNLPEFRVPEKIDPITDYARILTASYEPEQNKMSKKSKENLWAGLNMEAGTFGMGYNNRSASEALMSERNAITRPGSTSGSAYRFGLAMGTRLSEKWVLQGGVGYMQQSADYISNLVTFDGLATAGFDNRSLSSSTYTTTNPYQLSNTQQFISLPMQAGYLLIDRKFGMQINTGIATDFFLQNVLNDASGNLNAFSQSAGPDSPYRSVNFSGLFGTELSYRFADNYRLSLVPGMRYAMHSMFKDDIGTSISPITMDVGLRFKYFFK